MNYSASMSVVPNKQNVSMPANLIRILQGVDINCTLSFLFALKHYMHGNMVEILLLCLNRITELLLIFYWEKYTYLIYKMQKQIKEKIVGSYSNDLKDNFFVIKCDPIRAFSIVTSSFINL